MRESDTQTVKVELIDTTFTLLDDYHENVDLRNKQYQESKNFTEDPEGDDENDEEDDPTETSDRKVTPSQIKLFLLRV
jgi:hypothetical protein